MTNSSVFLYLLIPFILWRIYKRVRRLVGRQHSRAWHHWAAAIFFPLLVALLGFASLAHPEALAALSAGVAGGVGLAIVGLRLTRFEVTPQGYFYTPNAHIGIALSLLFVGRILYRLVQVYTLTGPEAVAASQNFGRSPFTTLVVGLMAGYYTAYAIGLIRWRWRIKRGASAVDTALTTHTTDTIGAAVGESVDAKAAP
jgi:cytochrome b561